MENRQELFNYMSNQHGLTLLDSELNDIYSICIGHEEYVKMLNFILSEPTLQVKLEKAKELIKELINAHVVNINESGEPKASLNELIELHKKSTTFLEAK